MNPEDQYGGLYQALLAQRPGLKQQIGKQGDAYDDPASARALGAWGPQIIAGARALHARELAQQMMKGGM